MRRALTLASSVAGAAIVALDGTALTVAQPTLRHDLHASVAQVQWTGTGCLVAVSALSVFAGRLGDRHGHRRVFGIGMLGFGAASAGTAALPVCRALPGRSPRVGAGTRAASRAAQSDAPHTGHGRETGPYTRSLGNDGH